MGKLEKCQAGDLVRFRLANPDDFNQIAELRWGLKTGDMADFDQEERGRFVAFFADWLLRSENRSIHFHWVAEHGGRLIAVMSVRKIQMLLSPRKWKGCWAYLANVYTCPDFRGYGVDADLLFEVTRWAKHENIAGMIVWPRPNKAQFYESAGFEKQGSRLVLRLSDNC